jgi:hypothetical protein
MDMGNSSSAMNQSSEAASFSWVIISINFG